MIEQEEQTPEPSEFEAAKIRDLERRIKEQELLVSEAQAARVEAEQRALNRESLAILAEELGKREIAMSKDHRAILGPLIVWDADLQEFSGGDGRSVQEMLDTELRLRPHLAATAKPKQTTDSTKATELDLNNIRPGMSAEEKAKYWKRIHELMSEQEKDKGGQI